MQTLLRLFCMICIAGINPATAQSDSTRLAVVFPRFNILHNKVARPYHSYFMYNRSYIWLGGKSRFEAMSELIEIKKQSLYPEPDSLAQNIVYQSQMCAASDDMNGDPPKVASWDTFETVPLMFEFWNAEFPVWYSGRITPIADDQILQNAAPFYQSIIDFKITDGNAVLNNKKLTFKPLRYEGSFGNEAQMKQHIKALKNAQVNTVIVKNHNKRWLELCDSLGLYTIIEYQLDERMNGLSEEQLWHSLQFSNFSAQNLPSFEDRRVPNASLLFYCLKGGDQNLNKVVNQYLTNAGRYNPMAYPWKEIERMGVMNAPVFYADSALQCNTNKRILELSAEKYKPVIVAITNFDQGEVIFRNTMDFSDLSNSDYEWKLSENGQVAAKGNGILNELTPQNQFRKTLFTDAITFQPKKEYMLEIALTIRNERTAQVESSKMTFSRKPVNSR
ncbi:beta-galactosidase domain 4-containing protein [Dyadobacter sp. CY343]|uniref:beta-galactosidase domain 4-containing protein n=1 Tax=Dyadobacter sp. CY343 TaxID=2907299 RepID=UPI001F278841|nr:beta-galactosidase domain 4-containing protein [Dyadobacter sp. CY343]MCE7060838.1 hypothetical protein [Dyadobacter sp. CY343]